MPKLNILTYSTLRWTLALLLSPCLCWWPARTVTTRPRRTRPLLHQRPKPHLPPRPTPTTQATPTSSSHSDGAAHANSSTYTDSAARPDGTGHASSSAYSNGTTCTYTPTYPDRTAYTHTSGRHRRPAKKECRGVRIHYWKARWLPDLRDHFRAAYL